MTGASVPSFPSILLPHFMRDWRGSAGDFLLLSDQVCTTRDLFQWSASPEWPHPSWRGSRPFFPPPLFKSSSSWRRRSHGAAHTKLKSTRFHSISSPFRFCRCLFLISSFFSRSHLRAALTFAGRASCSQPHWSPRLRVPFFFRF